jgi:hypothetical protein
MLEAFCFSGKERGSPDIEYIWTTRDADDGQKATALREGLSLD